MKVSKEIVKSICLRAAIEDAWKKHDEFLNSPEGKRAYEAYEAWKKRQIGKQERMF